MSTQDKLINRFKGLPKDFSFDELSKLLIGFGYEKSNKGKTSGSRVRFINKELKLVVDLHKPHTSGSPIKETALKRFITIWLQMVLLKKKKRRINYE